MRVDRTERHIPNQWFRDMIWSKALAKAAIGIHVTPHGLRHAHASWLLAGGADLQVVKERLGHGSITTTTTERYLHSLPTANDAALHALDAIRGRKGQSVPLSQPGSLGHVSPEADDVATMIDKIKEMYEQLHAGSERQRVNDR